MKGFNFEKNLEHQEQAIKAIIGVFNGVEIVKPDGIQREFTNPFFDKDANSIYSRNIGDMQEQNNIPRSVNGQSNIIDIKMETGTGKTYTYTKTIFELNKLYGIFKFVVVVPTLPIKAGTIDFLKSDSAREHFKEQYSKTIRLHIVESKNTSKSKKSYMPSAVSDFVNAGYFEKDTIQVLIINTGMINSKTMQEKYDRTLLDNHSVPFEAISATKPFMIIDEPHKFGKTNKTWENLEKMNPQFIIRYGATFNNEEEGKNLVYNLSAVDSFNRNLVKGVKGYIMDFEEGNNVVVKFAASDGKEASLQLIDGKNTKTFKISKGDSLERVHSAIKDLFVEKLNKSTVVLSNGFEWKIGGKINPYSYAETLQEKMIRETVKHHFEQEKKYLTREVRIKPLTLFFIDNIEEYRNKDGYIRKTVEKYVRAEIKELLKTEKKGFYREYLEKTLEDVSKTHAGYFAVDKKETDEVIEREVNEILHDKKAILSIRNPRRFVFSKWTLREGWDNPNIFQICKLRSSGSEISKLQEVGRGLRLPVNEYGNRVKDEQFFLNYFVDFTENDFIKQLVDEINEKSGAISREDVPEKLTDEIIKQIVEKYGMREDNLLEKLDGEGVITRSNDFKENGFEYIKAHYPLIFEGVDSNKVRRADAVKKKLKVRVEKYSKLKELWEKLNEKVILEYKIENERIFKELFVDFLKNEKLVIEGVRTRTAMIEVKHNEALLREEVGVYESAATPISMMKYSDFLKQLALVLNINIKTIHKSFAKINIDINNYLNQSTIIHLKQRFDNYLLYKAINKFSIEYQKITSTVHPTTLTNESGEVKKEIDASSIGLFYSNEKVADNYLFEELFYDSELEKTNIKTLIKNVIIFTKIPKNSIKIPIAGGKSYSPDFAYVINLKNGEKKLYFVIETKDMDSDAGLRDEEKQKILHAQKFFGGKVQIRFKTQFNKDRMVDLIREAYQ